ncbi:cbb3-type cytochrome oxidase assembly protein CcoS [Catenovulum sp. 2E275]|uniref:cbb3-type cytochrome oxidase assembly protein CcoS n=1 Tax=Catenovulum sp. 2E275 TaxID=2980497 RepID=UPI0021D279AB|nr:cbb3-type cytochrome oxidase assembly protein CcoS [Catenovulum sp. 2E275]MCU4674528.1 cbb3-type cytochrome oxidase assembly protein CcoS [Catenovulum sp. 2E275]
MSVIYVLIPLAIIIVVVAIAIFFWAVKKNQFEDLDRQGFEILFDDDETANSTENQAKPQTEQQSEHKTDKPHL